MKLKPEQFIKLLKTEKYSDHLRHKGKEVFIIDKTVWNPHYKYVFDTEIVDKLDAEETDLVKVEMELI